MAGRAAGRIWTAEEETTAAEEEEEGGGDWEERVERNGPGEDEEGEEEKVE